MIRRVPTLGPVTLPLGDTHTITPFGDMAEKRFPTPQHPTAAHDRRHPVRRFRVGIPMRLPPPLQ